MPTEPDVREQSGAPAEEEARRRGRLKIFLGYAAGVGKTFAMLMEVRELKSEGAEVVVGYFEPHGRKDTMALMEGVELIPRKTLQYRGCTFEELDVDAVLRRRPQICAVDEFAHTNVPGSPRGKRWEDIQVLLDAGIDVLTTMNVQHLESLNDQIWQITGIRVRETIPDWVVKQAVEVVMIDLPPEALLNRLRRGVVYAEEKARRAMENFFKEPTLDALREMALRQTAHEVEHRGEAQGEPVHAGVLTRGAVPFTRGAGHAERLLIYVTAETRTASLIRRGRRMADYLGCECLAACITRDQSLSGLAAAEREALERHLRFARDLRIDTHIIPGADVAATLVDFARRHEVTQLYLPRPGRNPVPFRRTLVERVLRLAHDMQVIVVAERRPDASVVSSRDPLSVLRRVEAEERRHQRGRLKVFLGYASGVGKSVRMLDEGRRRRERGEDVIVAATQPVTSPEAEGLLQKMEVVPLRHVEGFPVMDAETILRRRPRVCLVDGLAYDNPPGSRNAHRWQDVEELLAAGISVVASVNLQYIEEQRPRVEAITGKRVDSTIPQKILSNADEIEVVDAPVETSLERAPENAARRQQFISHLRHIALLVAADVVDRQLEAYLERHGLRPSWGTQERILVSVTPQSTGIRMIESGRRNADRFHGEFFVVYVRQHDLTAVLESSLQTNLNRARALRAQIEILDEDDWVQAILEFARTHGITQIFVGHTLVETWSDRVIGGSLDRLIRKAESIDVRVFPQ